MTKTIYQIQIALKGFEPKIWRQVLVPSDLRMSDFHKVIQTTMGWENDHLHQFIKNKTYYSVKYPGDDMWEDSNNVDYKKKKMKLSDLLEKEKEKIIYEYDFGDSWEHEIILQKILPVDNKLHYPICVKGEMCCPPEDSGGVWGYAEMLDILKQPDHEEYESYLEWLGEDFDPEYFNKEEVNALLNNPDFGCVDFL